MRAPKNVRRKHVPQRTCVGCRQTFPKRTLVRVVRRPEGIVIDPTGKLAGRGAYLHYARSCWERGLKGALATALKCELTTEDQSRLIQFMDNLPVENLQTELTVGNFRDNSTEGASQTEAGDVR